MDSPVATELREILAHYNLGELVDYEKNERGFINAAYAIYTRAAGEPVRYFLRKYKRGTGEDELLFEHSLIEHLVARGAPVARIYPTRSGKSYLRRFEGKEDTRGVFYTIFDYLPGEDRFTWVDPLLTEGELSSSAAVLAQFHIDTCRFTPRGRRGEPKILDLLPVVAGNWSGSPAKSKGTVFDHRVQQSLELVSANIAATLKTLREPAVRTLPEMVIHCDFHPGNLKFSGERVTGLFDFDWSKVDLRLFDLGLALWYFCTSWQGQEDGTFRLDWARTFLRSYLDRLAAYPPSPRPARRSPRRALDAGSRTGRGGRADALAGRTAGAPVLTPEEARYLPVMINAGNLYVLNWTILDYFAKEVDPGEFLVFLDHSLNYIRWHGQPKNQAALEAMIASVGLL